MSEIPGRPVAATDRRPEAAVSLESARPWVVVLALVGAWLLVGFLSASQYPLAAWWAGGDGDWVPQLARELPVWQTWSLLTPLVVLLGRRFPLAGGSLLRNVPVHVVAAVFCALAFLGVTIAWSRLAFPSGYARYSTAELFAAFFRARFNLAVLIYWAILGVYYALWNARRLREREREAARAQVETERVRAELVESRLHALRSQLHPHFLFNTLHSIASLMDDDVPTARRLIVRLSALLRTVLDSSDAQEVPLSDEIEFLERYLDIERVRYGERLRVGLEIDEEAAGALVPPLILQPLVENAVRHGIAPLEDGGSIVVRARREGDRLRLEVRDTGLGYRGSARPAGGLGLRNTESRLENLYDGDHAFRVDRGDEGGVTVTIEIPFHRGPRETTAGACRERGDEHGAPATRGRGA